LIKIRNLKLTTSEDNISEITIDTLNRKELSNYPKKEKQSLSNEKEFNNLNSFYNDFLQNNKEFFERIGFVNISNDPIFYLDKESEIKKHINTNICEICNKNITRIFSKIKYW
jgi:hypothetical protein